MDGTEKREAKCLIISAEPNLGDRSEKPETRVSEQHDEESDEEYHSCDSSDDKPLEESQRSTLENHGTMKETDEETTSDDEYHSASEKNSEPESSQSMAEKEHSSVSMDEKDDSSESVHVKDDCSESMTEKDDSSESMPEKDDSSESSLSENDDSFEEQSSDFVHVTVQDEDETACYWICLSEEDPIEAVLLFRPLCKLPPHLKNGVQVRDNLKKRMPKHIVLLDLSTPSKISSDNSKNLCGIVLGNTTNDGIDTMAIKKKYGEKHHIWIIKEQDFASLRKKIRNGKIQIHHEKPMEKVQHGGFSMGMVVRNAASSVKNAAGSALHVFSGDSKRDSTVQQEGRLQEILFSDECSPRDMKEVISLLGPLEQEHSKDEEQPRYLGILETFFEHHMNARLLLCLGITSPRKRGRKSRWEAKLYDFFRAILERKFEPQNISHELCKNLKKYYYDDEVWLKIAEGSIQVYNDWMMTKPSDLECMEEYIFRLMFWASLINSVVLIRSGKLKITWRMFLKGLNWKNIMDKSIEVYSKGIMKGFGIRDEYEMHPRAFYCDDESIIELFCPEGIPFIDFSKLWIVLKTFYDYLLSNHINLLKVVTKVMCTTKDIIIKSNPKRDFHNVGRFFHSLFDHCYMTDDEMKQWVSMLVTFILDLKYLTIFSEFQTGTRYWKAIEDEVSRCLDEKKASRDTLEFIIKFSSIKPPLHIGDALSSYMKKYKLSKSDNFSDEVWQNALTFLKLSISNYSQTTKILLQKIMDLYQDNHVQCQNTFFLQILHMKDSEQFFDNSLKEWYKEKICQYIMAHLTTVNYEDILKILIIQLRNASTKEKNLTVLQEVIIDIILQEVITEDTLQDRQSEKFKMFYTIVQLHKSNQNDILLLKFCVKCIENCSEILKDHWTINTGSIKHHFNVVLKFYNSGAITLLTEAYHKICQSRYTISMSDTTQQWISTIERVFEKWLHDFEIEDVTLEDCFIFIQNCKELKGVYMSLGKQKVYDDSLHHSKKDLQQFKKLLCSDIKDEILPLMEMCDGSLIRINVREMLCEYGVKFSDELDAKLEKMIIPNCCRYCVDSMCQQKNDMANNKCYRVSLDFKLKQCSEFHKKIKSFLMPLQPDDCDNIIILWKNIKKYPLLSRYVMAFMKKEGLKPSPIQSLSIALVNTIQLFGKVIRGDTRLTWGDYTVDELLDLEGLGDDRYVAEELKKIYATTGLYKCTDQMGIGVNIERSTNMLILIRTYPYISTVSEVCQQYGMNCCLQDQITTDLMAISDECKTCDSRHKLSPETAGEYLRKIQNAFLLKDSSDHMIIFDEVKNCENFHKFIMVQFFSNDQDESTGTNSFHTWYDIISNQLQNLEFERQILNHLFLAFEYMLPFVNKNQTLEELMSKIKKLNSATEFKELRTVSVHMHHIENWSSRAEGDFTVENVQRDLESIMTTGFYSFEILPKFTHGHPFEIVLKFTAPKGKKLDVAASDSAIHEEWRKEQISDFEQKLALVDDIEGKDDDIQLLIKWNEIARRLLTLIEKLHELGCPNYQEFCSNLEIKFCSELETNKLHIEEAKKRVVEAEQTFDEWRGKVNKLRSDYKWLLLLTTNKINRLFTLLQDKNTKALTQEIGHLFKNAPDVRHLLNENIEISEDMDLDTPFEAVGKYLNNILGEKKLSSYVLPTRHKSYYLESLQVGGILHIAIDFTQSDVIKLMLTICGSLPESYDVLYCGPDTTAQDLELFTDRCCAFGKDREFYFLEINKLLYEQQEVLMNLYQNIKHESLAINFIETEPSLLREVPGIRLKEYEINNLDSIRDSVKSCKLIPQEQPAVELVYGPPGVGKTYYIRQKKLLNLPCSVIIAMNETFSVKSTIQKLNEISDNENCGVFFNFTVNNPGDSVERDQREYKKWVKRVSWFFFKLLVTGYVEDIESGESFQLPAGLGWKIYVEVPSEDGVSESLSYFVEQQFPVLAAYGKEHCIRAGDQFDIDNDALIVYKYLRAYDDGRINSLCIEDISRLEVGGVIDIKLSDGLSEKEFKKLMARNHLSGGFETIVKNLFVAYQKGLIKRVYLQAKEVRFAAERNPTDEECWHYIYNKMPQKVQSSKVLQKLYIRYLSRRFNFLENFPGYNYNSGAGATLNCNSVALGKTLVDAMIAEVGQMCDQQSWSSKVYQQLIYDFKDGSGTFGYISVDLNKDPELTKSLRLIGVDIPNDMRLMKERKNLDSCLARALGVPLVEGRLKLIDECDYVLTLDFASKMTNIHERRKCGIPVIIEGETGVGKTFLIEMLSKLWNYKYACKLKFFKEEMLNSFQEAMKSEGKICIAEAKILFDALQSGRDIITEEFDALLDKNQNSVLLMKNALNCALSHGGNVTSLAVCQIPDSTSVVRYMDEVISSLKESSDKKEGSVHLLSILNARMIDIFHKLDIHAALTTDEITSFFKEIFLQAKRLFKIHGHDSPDIIVYLDEVNTSSCLGLLKEVIVDASMNGEVIPSNVFIIAACNPHRGDSTALSHCKANYRQISDSYFVRKLHPTLSLLKWDYGALSADEEHDYIREKLTMLQKNTMQDDRREALIELVVESQAQMRKLLKTELKKVILDDQEAESRASCCVSQRDIQRVIKFYVWLLNVYDSEKICEEEDDHHRRALLVSLGLVYYVRLPENLRKQYVQFLDQESGRIGWKISFKEAFRQQLEWYSSSNNLELPSGIAKTDALKENILAVIMCCVTRTPLIIEGAPGTSKTLSFNVAVANLKGKGSRKAIFQNHFIYPALEPQFYQCSKQTNSEEIKVVFKRAIQAQMNRTDKMTSLSVVFMDEAGLPEREHEPLKILHYYLEHPEVSFVAITNHPLDAAKTNRAISVYRPEASSSMDELRVLAKDCLGINPVNQKIEQLCRMYKAVMEHTSLSQFYGLRDFIYFLIHLCGKIDGSCEDLSGEEKKHVLCSIERNFGGSPPAYFGQICKFFFGSDDIPLQRSVLEVLKDSLTSPRLLQADEIQYSIQSSTRFQLIIDPSEDQSITRLLFTFGLLDRSNTKMIVCSNLPGDIQKAVSTIAKIRHSAQKGNSVILSQVDDIQASFYDLFNQRFRCVYIKNENRYYANISCGAHSRLSRIHPNFCCSVILRESDIGHTPGPFLNRFEKYYMSYDVLLDHSLQNLPETLRNIMKAVNKEVVKFAESLGYSKSFYGYTCSTISSLLIKCLPTKKMEDFELLAEDFEILGEHKRDGFIIILEVICSALREICGFKIVMDQNEFEEAKEIFKSLKNEGSDKLRRIINELQVKEVNRIIMLINDVFEVLYEPKKETLPEVYLIISVMVHFLTRYFCKCLMQVLTPEGLALHHKSIPQSFCKHYMDQQEHFSLKFLLSNHIKKMNQSQISSKILCYTRSSSLTSKLFPEEYHHINIMSHCLSQYEAVLNSHVYDSKRLSVCKFSNRLSQQNLEQALSDFFHSQEKEVFLFVVGIQESTKKKQTYINQIRIIMEQEESDHMRNGNKPRKLLVLLLLFPPRNFIKACYPCIFLEGWEHYYLDSISQASYEDSAMCRHINIRDWFRQFCLQNSTDELTYIESYKAFLHSILSEAVPVLVSRLQFGNSEKHIFNKKMEVHKRSIMIKDLLEEKGIGDILVERFQSCWNPTIVSNYIQKAALHTFDHDSTLNLADQIQVLAQFLFTEFLVYMIHVMNRNMGLDILFSSESVSTVLLLKKFVQCIPIPELHELEGSKYHNLISNDMTNSEYLKPLKFPYFHHVYDVLSKIIGVCREKLVIESGDVKDEIWLAMAIKEWKSILVELDSTDELFLTTLFNQVECDEKAGSQSLWNLYVQDFLSNKFILDPNYKLLPKDVEILKHKVDSSPKTAPVDRFFKLHIQIAVNRLKLTQALPTLRRLHELSSSYGMEAATAKSHFSSDVIIKMLFDYLKDFIDKENSEDKLLSWYDLFIEIALSKNFFYSDAQERWNMATILWLCYLTVQCAKFSSAKIVPITQKMFHIPLELHLSTVLVEGIKIIHEMDENEEGMSCIIFSEGVLEHYFSEHHKVYNTTDVKWYIQMLNQPECNILQQTISRGIAKFFLKRILTRKHSQSMDNVLCLFEDQARLMVGSSIDAANEVDGSYIPTACQSIKKVLEGSNEISNKCTWNLADIYFEIILEILADKSDLSSITLYRQCEEIKQKIEVVTGHDEMILLLIEKEALVHSLIQCLTKGDRPEKVLKERLTINMSKMICNLLSESMILERSFVYALSLLKNDNIRSTSKLIRVMKDVMKDKDSLIEHKNFIKPFIENIPNEYSVQGSWHLFSFLVPGNDSELFELGTMYKNICVVMLKIRDKEHSAAKAELTKLASKSISDDEICTGITGKRAFIMLLWLCIYHEFFCKKISSRRLAQAFGEVLQDQYCDEYLNILRSFIDPKNYAIDKPEPPIPYNFTPDSGVYPTGHSENLIDSVYELFTVLDDNDERICFLRHSIANMIAVIFALPAESNHLYYHLFAPDQLQGTFVTGYMLNRFVAVPYYYDCGVELTVTGDYGRPYYAKDLISLRTEYMLLLINFSAFVVSLYTQPDGESRIHGKMISPQLPVRNYCTGQLFTAWHHLQQSMNMSVEEVALLVNTCLEKFIEVSIAQSDTLRGLYRDKSAFEKYERLWDDEVFKPSYLKSCKLSEAMKAEAKALACLQVLDQQYPHHFHTYIDLKRLRTTDFSKYGILFEFLKEYNQLKYGGDLLPDLIRFYQWLHHDLSNLITKEDALTKSIQMVVTEYSESDQSAYVLYERVKVKYNRYVEAVGGKIGSGACAQQKRENKLDEISDDTKLMAYLSTDDGDTWQGDWLFHVIKDIIKVQTRVIEDIRQKNEGLECFFTKQSRTIHPLEVNEEECIVGGNEISEHNDSHFTQLIRRRWGYGKDIDESILSTLEIDVILHYLANKPKITDPTNIRTMFLFKRKMKTSQDEAKIISTKELCQELRSHNELKVELNDEQCKELDFLFHTKDYEDIYKIQSGLRNIADHVNNEIKEKNDLGIAELKIPTFLFVVVKVSNEKSTVYDAVGLERLSSDEKNFFQSILISQLCDTVHRFIEMIEDGYYDFYSLPIGLKKRLAKEDHKQLEENFSKVSFQGQVFRNTRQFQVELDGLIDVLVVSEDHIRDTLSECSQVSIVKYLTEDLDVIEMTQVVKCIPRSVKIENYVHLQVLLRRSVNKEFKMSAFDGEDWKVMPIAELWKKYLPEVKLSIAMKSEDLTRVTTQQPSSSRSTVSDHSVAGENKGDWIEHARRVSVADVGDFLRSIKLDRYADSFFEDDVDGTMLADIVIADKRDVLECLNVKNVLHIQKIYSKFSTFCLEFKPVQ